MTTTNIFLLIMSCCIKNVDMHIYVSILFSQHVKTIDAWSEKRCVCGTAHVDWIGLNLNKAKTKKQSKNKKNKKTKNKKIGNHELPQHLSCASNSNSIYSEFCRWLNTMIFQEDGSVDLSYFSPDCFHLSERGQESAAYALWDNMVS